MSSTSNLPLPLFAWLRKNSRISSLKVVEFRQSYHNRHYPYKAYNESNLIYLGREPGLKLWGKMAIFFSIFWKYQFLIAITLVTYTKMSKLEISYKTTIPVWDEKIEYWGPLTNFLPLVPILMASKGDFTLVTPTKNGRITPKLKICH